MGILRRLRERANQEEPIQPNEMGNQPSKPIFSKVMQMGNEGQWYTKYEYYDPMIQRNFNYPINYDTIRLILNMQPVQIPTMPEVTNLYAGWVSWYGRSDPVLQEGQNRSENYQQILIQYDPYMLKSDTNYQMMLMEGLLEERRVKQYIQDALSNHPQRANGFYLGSIEIKPDHTLGKFLNSQIGRYCQYMPDFQAAQYQYQSNQQAQQRQEDPYGEEYYQ